MVSRRIMTCQMCGYPLAKAVLRAGGGADTPYCRCCAHEDGTARCRSELIECLMNEAMGEDGVDYFEALAWATAEVASMSPGPSY
jgi:uncharacterized protein YdiU (UPF0061 family)